MVLDKHLEYSLKNKQYHEDVPLPSGRGSNFFNSFKKELTLSEVQQVLAFYKQQQKPIKISRKDLPQELAHLQFSYSIFIDEFETPFALYEGKEQALKRTLNDKQKVASQVKRGHNLLTKEAVAVKIETLSPVKDLQGIKRQIIDNEVLCGKKAQFIQSSGYIPLGSGFKHYQFSKWAPGKPLPEPQSALNTERFNPLNLSEEQKIAVAVSVINALKTLHFVHGVLHRDLYGDNIYICEATDGSFVTTFIDYGLSAPLTQSTTGKLTYTGPLGDDIWLTINTLAANKTPTPINRQVLQTIRIDVLRALQTLTELDIQNHKVLDLLMDFKEQKDFVETDYDTLIYALQSCSNKLCI